MNRNALLLTALLALAAMAGCVEDTDPNAVAPEVPDDPVSQEVGAETLVKAFSSENTTLSPNTPFLMPANAGPDTPLTAFRWRIPDGVIQTITPIPDFPDFNYDMIMLEMVPVIPGNATLDEFAILAVNLEDEAYITSSYVGVPQTGTATFAFIDEQDISYDPELDSLFFRIYAEDLDAGDEVGFILAGRTDAPTPFGMLAAPLTDEPDYEEGPADTTAELLDGRTAVTLEATGAGAGLQMALYLNENIVFATSIYNFEVTTPAMQVEDRQRAPTEPVATARDSTLRAEYPTRGHSEAFAEYFALSLLTPNCVAVGTYDIQMDVHGTIIDHRGVISENPVTLGLESLVTGSPIAFVTGEGQGPSSTSFDVEVASSCSLELLLVEQFDIGATLQDLFGVPALVGGAAFDGIIGNIPPSYLWAEGSDLVLLHDKQLQRLPGLGYLLDEPSLVDA